jgi:Domain of unknown function (DUF4145)
MPFNWTCPYCERDTTIDTTTIAFREDSWLESSDGLLVFVGRFICCPNPSCTRITLLASLFKGKRIGTEINRTDEIVGEWQLVPPSSGRRFPDYVPAPLLADYHEACSIRDLSPKASATLSRRVLQGMIRDFFGVSEGRLVDEIKAIRDRIDPLTWQAIDALRKIGNIGAHMEKDINVIVDVDPGEADRLIWLIERLIRDWYVTRHEREKNLREIAEIGDSKTENKTKPAAKS